MSDKNPYNKAADAYSSTAAETDQRALEGRVLLKAAQKLEALATRLKNGEKVAREEIGDIMEYNQKLWIIFASDVGNAENQLPLEVKNNIASLGLFVFKRTQQFLIDTTPEKLSALIEINRNIASGLLKQQTAQPASSLPGAPALPGGGGKPAPKGNYGASPKESPTRPDKSSTDSLI